MNFFGIWPPDVPTPPMSGASVLLFGAGAVQAGSGVRYMVPGFTTGAGSASPIAYRAPRDGVIGDLRVRQVGNGNGNALTYRLRLNGAPSALSVTMASTATDGDALGIMVPVSAGDLLDFEAFKPVSLGSSPQDIMASMAFM